jgi:hypothetical protein
MHQFYCNKQITCAHSNEATHLPMQAARHWANQMKSTINQNFNPVQSSPNEDGEDCEAALPASGLGAGQNGGE